jgi:16S rRNA G966 N2-methylase RsmD
MPFKVHTGAAHEIVPTLGEFDIVMADPPYTPTPRNKRSEWQFTDTVQEGLEAAAAAVTPNGAMFVFTGSSGKSIERVLRSCGVNLPLTRLLYWRQRFVTSAAAGPWGGTVTPIFVFGAASWGHPKAPCIMTTDGMAGRHARAKTGKPTGHVAEVPLVVSDWLLTPFEKFDRPLRVLDPFCGTGALLFPAVARRWEGVGVEIKPEYAKLAERRLAVATRQTHLGGMSHGDAR